MCAGLDLSRLHGSYVAAGIDGSTATAHENGWQYRVDVCDEIPLPDKPAGCPDTASHVLQYPTPPGQRRPDMPKQEGCNNIGSEVKTAKLVMRAGGDLGVDLTFRGSVPSNSSAGGRRATNVTGHLTCDKHSGNDNMKIPGQIVSLGVAEGTGVECYEFDWATEAVCDEKRPRGRPSVPAYCSSCADMASETCNACSCAAVDTSALKSKVYTVKGGGNGGNWTYVMSICGPIPEASTPERTGACAHLPAATTALRYSKPVGSASANCEPLGSGQITAVPTTNGVELLYGSAVNSSNRCPDGASLQLSVICDASADAHAAPGVVTDISSATGSDNACVFAARLRTPCAAPSPAETPSSNVTRIILIVLACVVGVAALAGMFAWKRKRDKASNEPLISEDSGNLGGATSW